MAREKVDNKLNVVIGTKAQIEGDASIPENSIIVVTDEELTPSDIPNLEISKITGLQTALDGKVDKNGGITVETWNTTTKTLALSDANKLFVCSSTGNQTVTVPLNVSVPFPIGTMITFLLKSTDKVTFMGAEVTSIDDAIVLATLYGMASLIKINTNSWQLVGALE